MTDCPPPPYDTWTLRDVLDAYGARPTACPPELRPWLARALELRDLVLAEREIPRPVRMPLIFGGPR